MGFHNVKLPDNIAQGFEAGPGASTVVQSTASGHEYRVQRAAQLRHRYRGTKDGVEYEEWSELLDFFHGRRGALHGFRFKDWGDYSTAEDGVSAPGIIDVVLGTGNGSDQTFQLSKLYDGTGPAPYSRPITLPVAGTVKAAINGVETTDFTVDTTTGIVTFNVAPGNGLAVQGGCEFDVPVRFGERTEEWMAATHDHYNNLSFENFDLIEILDELEWPELWHPGGTLEGADVDGYVDKDKDFTIGGVTKVWPIDPTVAGLSAFLPPPDRIPGGEVYVFLIKSGPLGDLVIRDDAGTAVTGTLTGGEHIRIALLRSGSNATWLSYT